MLEEVKSGKTVFLSAMTGRDLLMFLVSLIDF